MPCIFCSNPALCNPVCRAFEFAPDAVKTQMREACAKSGQMTAAQIAAHVEAGEMPELSMSMFATSADYHAAMAGAGEVGKVCTCDELGHTCKWCAYKQWKAEQEAKGEAGEMEAATDPKQEKP